MKSATKLKAVTTALKRRKAATPEMVEFAREAYLSRLSANTASRAQRRNERDLERLMLQNDVLKFEFGALGETIDVQHGTFPAEYIDPHKLYTMVDLETFLQLVKVTKTDVIEHPGAGKAVCAKATVITQTEPRLKIEPRK